MYKKLSENGKVKLDGRVIELLTEEGDEDDVLDESLDFYTKSSMEARMMYTNMMEKKKRDLDEKVICLLREDIVSDATTTAAQTEKLIQTMRRKKKYMPTAVSLKMRKKSRLNS